MSNNLRIYHAYLNNNLMTILFRIEKYFITVVLIIIMILINSNVGCSGAVIKMIIL